jgi:hypothetical protein
MPQPTISDVHIDVALTNFSLAYFQRPDNYIATKVFPVVPVDKQSNKYWIWTKNDWMTSQVEVRPPGTESAGSGFTLSNTSYYANVYALHKDLDHQTAANADMDLERATSLWLTQQALLKMERSFVTDFMTTGIWSLDYTGVASAPSTNQFVQWSNRTSSDPRSDIETAKLQVLSTTGFEPNTLVLGYQTYQALKQHPDFRSQIQYTSPESVTADIIGKILDIPRVFVSKGVYATNLEGETAAYSMVQGKSAWLGYVNPMATTESATAGVTFVWTGLPGASGNQIAVNQFYIPETKVQRYEIELAYSNAIIGSDLGVYFTTAIS